MLSFQYFAEASKLWGGGKFRNFISWISVEFENEKKEQKVEEISKSDHEQKREGRQQK